MIDTTTFLHTSELVQTIFRRDGSHSGVSRPLDRVGGGDAPLVYCQGRWEGGTFSIEKSTCKRRYFHAASGLEIGIGLSVLKRDSASRFSV